MPLDGRAHAPEVLGVDLDEGEVPLADVGVPDEGDRAELDAFDVANALADALDAVGGGAEVGRATAVVDEVQGAGAGVGLVVRAGLQRGRGGGGARREGQGHDGRGQDVQ
jgi:hypothetical protein